MATGRKTGGRKAGVSNIISGNAKDNIAAVFTRLGSTTAMAEWAKENQTQFYQIYSKLLPHEVTGKDGAPITPPIIQFVIDEDSSN